MRYVQLRAFHYVAICGGFSRAAEELLLTQPAISDQVRKLEEEYDILLFNRHRKQVTMTPSGEKLLEITRRLFDNEEQARELLTESRATRAGTLRIVADSALHVLKILARFRQKYPGVGVTISGGNTETVIASLFSYEADIGILGELPPSRDFETVALNSTPISAFVALDHPIAQRKSLGFQDLQGLPLVMRESGSKTRKKFEEAAEANGFVFTPSIIAEGREAVREIVASGVGVGFVSAAEFGEDPRLVRIPLEEEEQMMMDETLICLRERRGGKLVSAFLKIAHEEARNTATDE
ncbi:LysR substrate-binding domain-containing protein [Hoeflea sp. YIM 152468]|uniref:LysR substrate-binding domain-containing protein n=1 Tax=Hoeflea sp. YIM 152468 TaxID=3031759 RepID=UPI0023DC4B65|nr:LysR substrate-binding domain-containing protein [Hoeflea sp. YIM 152468]MDF1607995.1 LysR substrate-binding domain-containing protein [Hoeflea sp. YIM 152468]